MSIEHSSQSESITWTGIIGDLGLAIIKGTVGYFSGSKALLGDALYSTTGVASSLADKLPWRRKSFERGKKRSDRIESVVAVLISVLVLMGGLQVAAAAIWDLSVGEIEAPSAFALIAIFCSIMIKEAIFQFQYRQSKKINDGKHTGYITNHRYEIYASLIVFIGVFLSMIGDMYSWPGLLYTDSVAALLMSCIVLRRGYILIVNAVQGKMALHELEENSTNFIDTVQRVQGVITVDDLRAQEQGHYVIIHVRISVNPRITVFEAHDIAECAKKLLMHRFLHVIDAIIQVVPYDPGYPYKSNHDLSDRDLPTWIQ
ncbi:cation diffusion facilitator family transporter [Paenibacillus sp. DS2015]|uniref:cation diffusion facilitator family transporter n=1 Tax=Paenibacillus sp. DS2015 TaxID=3373917 RepID=UPI003D2390CF